MKKVLFVLTLVIGGLVRGQFINIPDTSFHKFLMLKYPSCFNVSKQLDTVCAAAQSDTSMEVYLHNNPMWNLTGIQYFMQLKELKVEYTRVNHIPMFPPNLTYISWIHNEVVTLPPFPTTLKTFICWDNKMMMRLPQFPNGIIDINCWDNMIDSLPNLPNSLRTLDCGTNSIASLPSLPNGTEVLKCRGNLITSLPALPLSLLELDCGVNQIAVLPNLPKVLRTLSCDNNQLTYLPTLPDSLGGIVCGSNQLTILPSLPTNLYRLNCEENQLTNLPILPYSLIGLNCLQNQIHCLPTLPTQLNDVYFDYLIKITCIPNIPNSKCWFHNVQFGGRVYPSICDSLNDTYNCRNIVLPLKIVSFTTKLQQNNVALNWQTTNEINVSHFNMQRSNNGKDFSTIGKVNAACCEYHFTDPFTISHSPFTYYYRLEIVDKDGSKTYSEIKQIRLNQLTNKPINVFPNPATAMASIDCNNAKQILIIDYLGKTIKQFNHPTQPQTINTKQLNKGIYIIKAIMNNGEIKTEKLVVE